ncbi:hypothetical protein HMPREF9946_01214 [Acetobacteraceae bacterium AT-5844]|nr:hypothetical protein HMPREF9946_01214 [Acetobacteraceae bacterium AT-5844]
MRPRRGIHDRFLLRGLMLGRSRTRKRLEEASRQGNRFLHGR